VDALKYWFYLIPPTPTILAYLQCGCAKILTQFINPCKSCKEINFIKKSRYLSWHVINASVWIIFVLKDTRYLVMSVSCLNFLVPQSLYLHYAQIRSIAILNDPNFVLSNSTVDDRNEVEICYQVNQFHSHPNRICTVVNDRLRRYKTAIYDRISPYVSYTVAVYSILQKKCGNKWISVQWTLSTVFSLFCLFYLR
jgi:hypothetical protein